MSWTPPANTGGGSVTSYVITDNNGHQSTVSGTSTSATIAESDGRQNGFVVGYNCYVSGLNYTFTVAAKNSYGTGASSSASNAIGGPGLLTFQTNSANCGGKITNYCIYQATWTVSSNTGGVPLTAIWVKTIGGIPDSDPNAYCFPTSQTIQLPITAVGYSVCSDTGPEIWVQNAFGATSPIQAF